MGIIAAQSIGEPGTQLTMRTFHTGGVAGADITHGLPRVVELFEARKPKGLAKIAEQGGTGVDRADRQGRHGRHHRRRRRGASPHVPAADAAVRRPGQKIEAGTQLNEGSLYPAELLAVRGRTETERYLVREVQEVYKSQGVDINDKHIELIVRQMMKKVRVDQKGDTRLPARASSSTATSSRKINADVKKGKGEQAQYEEIVLGITKASLNTDSFLSAASFQETTKVLTDAALEGKKDTLNGLKENVIIGKLIPAATGLKRYRRIEIEPSEPLPRAIDDVGLLDEDELGRAGPRRRRRARGFGAAFDDDLGPRGDRRRRRRPGFAEELADARRPRGQRADLGAHPACRSRCEGPAHAGPSSFQAAAHASSSSTWRRSSRPSSWVVTSSVGPAARRPTRGSRR